MNFARHFESQRVLIGGEQYESCTFIDCELVFDGRPAHLVDNRFESCRWSFEGPAGLTLGFLTTLCHRAGLARGHGPSTRPRSREAGRPRPQPAPAASDSPARFLVSGTLQSIHLSP
jgi:hypothetical protein